MNPRLNKAATLGFYNCDLNKVYNINKFDIDDPHSPDNVTNTKNFVLLREHLGTNSGAKKILEVGCAKGHFLSIAQKAGHDVYGVELNSKNADIARSRVGDRIYEQDIFELALATDSFDVIYSRDLIEHIHNPDEFLREISRILKTDGILFFETHNIESLANCIVKEKHTVIFGFEHPVHWSPKTLSNALARHQIFHEKTYFESKDFTLKKILKYYLASTFTTVYRWEAPKKRQFLIKCLIKFLNLPIIKTIDDKLIPLLANFLGRGSTMKLVARKHTKKDISYVEK
ncbi:MAG: class I SAM-dependent methyltransferase [Bacteriovoracia bacterium]